MVDGHSMLLLLLSVECYYSYPRLHSLLVLHRLFSAIVCHLSLNLIDEKLTKHHIAGMSCVVTLLSVLLF